MLTINKIKELVIHKNKKIDNNNEKKKLYNKSFSVNAHKHPLTPTTHRQ